ncbi:MAG: hypothetical protein BM564_13290 [Bacteroidetes bacterium MedPE-SWsnd-G2]|nr:MAG: hypothetical protein BM564_13290 [Bacteroidetes bacterium MedPE-SWsnd-G2]
MKIITLLLILLSTSFIQAQLPDIKNNTFVRVFDLDGHKIAKGEFAYFSNDQLNLKDSDGIFKIPLNKIGYLKTKTSAGHNIVKGLAIGGLFTFLGILTLDQDADDGDHFNTGDYVYGTLFGSIIGGVTGAIVMIFHKSEKHIINGPNS